MSHWPAHQSLLRHQSHWSRLPRPGLPSDTKENGQQEQGLGPNTCPRTNLSVPHLPAQPIRIQSSDSGSRRGQGGGTLGFSQGKENRCLGKETALGNRGCSPDHLMGFKAKVQESWSPPPPPVKTSHATEGGERGPGLSLPCHSLSLSPVSHVPVESVKGPELDGITCVSSLGAI